MGGGSTGKTPKMKKVTKEFPCVIIEMRQRTTGKHKKYPSTLLTLRTNGLMDQKVFEEIIEGVCNGHRATIIIDYLLPIKRKT